MRLSIVDEAVCEKIAAIKKVFTAHNKLTERLSNDVEGFFPEEILSNSDNISMLESYWEFQKYDLILREYVSIWIRFYEYVYDEETAFSEEDFINGKVQGYLNII